MQSRPVAPPMSHRVLWFEKSNLAAKASKLIREAGHRTHELLESREFCVKFLEHALLAMFDFILRPSGAQGFGQIVPELEKPVVQHHQPTADIARAALDKIEGARGGVEVLGGCTVPLTVEELHRHKGVKKIANAARVQTEL